MWNAWGCFLSYRITFLQILDDEKLNPVTCFQPLDVSATQCWFEGLQQKDQVFNTWWSICALVYCCSVSCRDTTEPYVQSPNYAEQWCSKFLISLPLAAFFIPTQKQHRHKHILIILTYFIDPLRKLWLDCYYSSFSATLMGSQGMGPPTLGFVDDCSTD